MVLCTNFKKMDCLVSVAFRSPYDPKVFVKIEAPNILSLQELRRAGELSGTALSIVRGKAEFDHRYPFGPAGALGLVILSRCCTAQDDVVVSGLLGGYSFVRQMKGKLETKEVDEELMADSARQFRTKYGPHFKRFVLQWLNSEHAPWASKMIGLVEKHA